MQVTSALAIVALALLAGHARKRRPIQRGALAGAGLALAFVPLGGLPLAGYLRGFAGDLSITTTTVVLLVILSQLFDMDFYEASEESRLLSVVAVIALVLYPMALGLSSFDSYAIGFGSWWLLGPLLVLVTVAWYFESYLIVACLVAAVGAYALDLSESRNLWDYLVDPWISGFALVALTGRVARARRTR